MSEFIKKLDVEVGEGRKYATFNTGIGALKFESGMSPMESQVYRDTLRSYYIHLIYENRFYCDPSERTLVKENAVRDLKECLFGDLRKIAVRLTQAFYERDVEKLRQAIAELDKELY